MLRGLATITFYANDHDEAKRWYADLLGMEPYFDKPGYFEFRIGDFPHELGVIDGRFAPTGGGSAPGGEIAYWHVDDLQGSLETLISKGATEFQPITARGEGFVTASVVDPFGNILGIMTNPHYLEMLGLKRMA